jgi:hypothetical protein
MYPKPIKCRSTSKLCRQRGRLNLRCQNNGSPSTKDAANDHIYPSLWIVRGDESALKKPGKIGEIAEKRLIEVEV